MQRADTSVRPVLALLGGQGAASPAQIEVAQALVEVLPIPVFFKDRTGRYLGVNRAWEEFFETSREAIVGGTVREVYPDAPAIAARHESMDEALWLNPGSQMYEIQVTTRGGRVRHCLYYKATFAGPGGNAMGLIGTVVDITERKQAEQREAIESAVARELGSADTLGEAIRGIIHAMCQRLDWACGARWRLDEADGKLRCAETWSTNDDEIEAFLAESSRAVFTPGKGGLIRRCLASNAPVWIADVTTKPDFQRAALAAKAGLKGAFALPVLAGDHAVGAIEFFSRDAREPDKWMLQLAVNIGREIGMLMARRDAESAMRSSEARFRSLTELSSDWYWEQDENLRYTHVSRGIFEALGVEPESLLGQRRGDAEIVGISDEEWKAHLAVLEARERFQDFEYGRKDAKGRVHYMSSSGHPIFDEAGVFRGYRGIGKDITQRKIQQQELEAAHDELAVKARELARSNEELQQFAYVASHDLQEPLRMISSYTQLLGRRYGDRLDGDAKDFMEFIVDGSARMKQLIEDLLLYSRVGTRGREFAATDSGVSLQKALVNLRTAQEQSGATVTHDPMPTVVADGAQLVQLFQNLLGNAMKFRSSTEPCRIHVGVKQNSDEYVFMVRDNGIGLDPQYAERIFMMFQRLHNRTEYPGTGIGLAICKKIVDRHGGRIWVDSQPGQGCHFGFTLPVQPGGNHS